MLFSDSIHFRAVDGAVCDYIGSDDYVLDLVVLGSTDHVIMSTNTYGWWAAYMAGGHTIYYKHQARNGSRYGKNFNNDDFFPPDWIPLE